MKVLDIWYLDGIKDFNERKLIVGREKKSKKTKIILFETRITDGQIFITEETAFKAEKTIEREKSRVIYTRQDVLNSKRGKPCGWIYGDNREVHNRNGKIATIKQYRKSFSGQKELVKTIDVN